MSQVTLIEKVSESIVLAHAKRTSFAVVTSEKHFNHVLVIDKYGLATDLNDPSAYLDIWSTFIRPISKGSTITIEIDTVNLTPDQVQHVLDLRDGDGSKSTISSKIEAIKYVKDVTSCGLKTAKQYIEGL
jgi:hypothetical protein